MIPLDINTAHFRWDRLEAVTIELAVLVLLSGRKERKRRHNDNMRKTDKTSINILILCLTMDGNWFLLVYKRPQKLYPMPHFRWVPDCDDDQTITSRERLSMVVVGDLWRFVKVDWRSRSCGWGVVGLWLGAANTSQQAERRGKGGREPAGKSILKHLGGAWELRWPQRQCDIMKKTMEMRRTDKWLESDQRGGDLV